MSATGQRDLAAVVTAAEASEILGVGKTRVHQLLNAGRLEWRMSGRVVLITRASVDAYARDVQQA